MSRNAFTMIELIFVIVILGVLAAVAIPKINATRDDAEIAKTSKNLSTLVSDIGVYYTSQAKIADSMKEMTNVRAIDGTGLKNNYLVSGGKKCIKISIFRENEKNDMPTHLEIKAGEEDASEPICIKVLASQSVTHIMSMRFKYAGVMKISSRVPDDDVQIVPVTKTTKAGEIILSGSNVKF